MHRAVPAEPSAGVRPPSRRVTGAGVLRSVVAAGGAVAGAAAALPVGAFLFVFLFEHLGTRIIDGIVSQGVGDARGLEAVFVGIALVIAAVMVAVMVVVALVAPVFVVLPMVGTGIALRIARSGLITRTLLLFLAAHAVLALGVGALLEAVGVEAEWWMWVIAVTMAAFLGRFAVEVWEPRRAAVRTPVVVHRRWVVLVVVWACLLVVAAVSGTALFLAVT